MACDKQFNNNLNTNTDKYVKDSAIKMNLSRWEFRLDKFPPLIYCQQVRLAFSRRIIIYILGGYFGRKHETWRETARDSRDMTHNAN